MGKNMNKNNIIIVLIVVVIGIFLWSNYGGMTSFSIAPTTGQPATPTTTTVCNTFGQKITFDIAPRDMLTPSNETKGTYNLIYGGTDLGAKTVGTTVSLDGGRTYDILTLGSVFYKTRVQGIAPCDLAPTITTGLKSQALRGALTVTVYNPTSYATENANASAKVAIGSGQTVVMKLSAQETTAKAYFSNPQLDYYVVTVQMNATDFDNDVTRTYIEGATATSVPSSVSAIAGTNAVAFKVTGTIKDFATTELLLHLSAKSGKNPSTLDGGTATAGADHTLVTFSDADWYQNTVSGAYESGITDNAGTGLGVTDATARIYYS